MSRKLKSLMPWLLSVCLELQGLQAHEQGVKIKRKFSAALMHANGIHTHTHHITLTVFLNLS